MRFGPNRRCTVGRFVVTPVPRRRRRRRAKALPALRGSAPALIRARMRGRLEGRVDHDDILTIGVWKIFRGIRQGSYDVPAGKSYGTCSSRSRSTRCGPAADRTGLRSGTWGHDRRQRDRRGRRSVGVRDQPLTFLKWFLEEALEHLTADQEQAIRLRMEEYEVEEIAAAMGRPNAPSNACCKRVAKTACAIERCRSLRADVIQGMSRRCATRCRTPQRDTSVGATGAAGRSGRSRQGGRWGRLGRFVHHDDGDWHR